MDNIYIKIIEAGLSFKNGFSEIELKNKVNSEESKKIIRQNIYSCDLNDALSKQDNSMFFKLNTDIYIISYGATFDYYDYKELQEARENAKSARIWSIIALIISIITLSVSIYYSNKQINKPVSIEISQLEKLIDSNK